MRIDVISIDQLVASVNAPTDYVKTDGSMLDATTTKIIDFVENSKYPVVPNFLYYEKKKQREETGIDTVCGYTYRFWFVDEESANEFVRQIGGTLEIPPIPPTR